MKQYNKEIAVDIENITWYPGCQDPEAFKVAQSITNTLFELKRPGNRGFIMRFDEDGRIDTGEGEYEYFWNLELTPEDSFLDIFVGNSRNCRLRKGNDLTWRGVSDVYQGVDLELSPLTINNKKSKRKAERKIGAGKPIHVLLNGQLGNCLRSIASASIMADLLDLRWDIDLTESSSPPYVIDLLAELFPGKLMEYPRYSYTQFDEKKYLTFSGQHGTNTHPLLEAQLSGLPTFEFGVRQIYAYKLRDVDIGRYIAKKRQFYKEIQWPSVLLAAVNDFSRSVNLSDLIGVHIRYTDNLTDQRKSELQLNTSIDSFVAKLSTLKGRKILLCSDNEDVRTELPGHIDGVEVFLAPRLDWRGMDYQPLFEMHLLGRTKYIIGSYSSTFSYEAAFIYGVGLELFENGEWVYYAQPGAEVEGL